MDPKKSGVNSYLRYAGLAFQIFGTIGVAALAGQWLDKRLSLSQPYLTMLFVIVAFGGVMYWIMLDTRRKP